MITAQKLIRKVRYLINETENDSDVTLITDDLRSIDDTILELLPQAVSIVQRQSKGKYVNVKALFYMKTKRKVDLTNLLEALDDVLVKGGMLVDDNCTIIKSHDGSRVLYDKENPRIEVEIERRENEWNI